MRCSKSDFHLRGSDAATEQRAVTGSAGLVGDGSDDDDAADWVVVVDASRTSPGRPPVAVATPRWSSLAIIVDTKLSTSEQTSPLSTATHRGRATHRPIDWTEGYDSTGRQIRRTALNATSSCRLPVSRRTQ